MRDALRRIAGPRPRERPDRSSRAPRRVTHSWLLDMDGVLAHEEQVIPGADRFLARLRELEVPFLVLTNNSIYTRRDLSARFRANSEADRFPYRARGSSTQWPTSSTIWDREPLHRPRRCGLFLVGVQVERVPHGQIDSRHLSDLREAGEDAVDVKRRRASDIESEAL